MDAHEVLNHAREAMTVKRVFGDPYEKDGVTVIPVAGILGGAGGAGAFGGAAAAGPGREPGLKARAARRRREAAEAAGDPATGWGTGSGRSWPASTSSRTGRSSGSPPSTCGAS